MLTAAIGGISKSGWFSFRDTYAFLKQIVPTLCTNKERPKHPRGCLESEVEKASTFSVVMPLKSEERTNAA
jgi:hypothetical protein